ncbi:hypothetical protein [Burkholderia ambifaria]|uniref:hypothetical protein n=1 Tax=Burkholderia ambifaria TaxID=152480 RepID=UPI00158D6520|nr:hypothetical protein [Burkholderia ambifaria]
MAEMQNSVHGPQGTVHRVLGIVAKQLTTWGGLARLVILLAVFAAGWLGYSGEWRGIANHIGSAYGRYKLRGDAQVDAHSIELMRLTGARSVVVDSVFGNQKRTIYMRLPGGRENRFNGLGDVLWPVGDHALLDDTARLMAGEVVCGDFKPRNMADRFLVDEGVAWACSVRAPHRHDGFAGIIALGFDAKPANVQYVRAKLAEKADAITE